MIIRIDSAAQPDDAPVIAMMVGELLHEIMASVEEKAFGFDQDETTARARSWIKERKYRVWVAREGAGSEPLGFLSLCDSYALYTEGPFE